MSQDTVVEVISQKNNISKSSSSQAQLLPSISSITPTVSPTLLSLSLSLSDAKENIKEQPSQAHCPRKLAKKKKKKKKKKNRFKEGKTYNEFKETPVKNTSLKTAREEDSPSESIPVSKRSRRRKTFKTSDAMDTDADPSDTDYVIGQASEDDESLLEAEFKQVADNPVTGPLSPSLPKKKITSLISCNCRGYRSHTDDVKDIIRQYHSVCA
ncbi:hypothetical protein TNCV_5136641 [Trichonephila clavipes]|nr:hypothetical protein TNCV_5136641 [Trichonephila clavipes]